MADCLRNEVDQLKLFLERTAQMNPQINMDLWKEDLCNRQALLRGIEEASSEYTKKNGSQEKESQEKGCQEKNCQEKESKKSSISKKLLEKRNPNFFGIEKGTEKGEEKDVAKKDVAKKDVTQKDVAQKNQTQKDKDSNTKGMQISSELKRFGIQNDAEWKRNISNLRII